MSTRTDATYDDATTASQPTDAATRDFSTTSTERDATARSRDAPATTPDATTSDQTAPSPDDGVPWTERCARQFDTTDRARCRTLADDDNAAMHDGV